jgi:hypothetical protein
MNQMISMTFRSLAESNGTNSSEYHDENEHEEYPHDDVPWGDVIAASLIVQLVALSGLMFTALSLCTRGTSSASFRRRLHEQIVPSFAAGALLATTVFLLLPESIKLLQGGHSEEHEDEVHDEDAHADDHRFLEEDLHVETTQDVHEDEDEAAFV